MCGGATLGHDILIGKAGSAMVGKDGALASVLPLDL